MCWRAVDDKTDTLIRELEAQHREARPCYGGRPRGRASPPSSSPRCRSDPCAAASSAGPLRQSVLVSSPWR